MKEKSIFKNSFFNIVYTTLNVLFPLITSMYVARILLPDMVGVVSYAQNTASYFVTLAALGIPTYGIREIAKNRENQQEKNKVFTELIIINTVSTLVALIGFTILVASVSNYRSDWLLYLCCGLHIFLNFINIDFVYKGEEEYVFIACRSILIKIISFVAVLVFVKSRNDYVIYALISSLALAGNYIFNVARVRKYVRFTFKNLNIKRHLTPIFILAISILLSTIYNKVDITMLGMMGADENVGLYSYSHKIVDIIITVCIAISAVFMPRLSYYYKNNTDKFNNLLKLGFKIVAFLSIPMSVGLFMLSSNAIQIMYGQEFMSASQTIRVFCPMIIIKSFGDMFCYQLIIATGNERKRLPAYIVAAILNIILNFILIPHFQQNGAAVASIIAELTVNAIQIIFIAKVVKFKIPFIALIQAIISSLIMGLFIWLVLHFISVNIIIQTLIAFVVGVTIYFICNTAMKNEFAFQVINKALSILRKKKA